MTPAIRLVCGGCGWSPGAGVSAFSCPYRAASDARDHVLVPHLDVKSVTWPVAGEDNPFLRFRSLLLGHAVVGDAGWRQRVDQLGTLVTELDGRGVGPTRVVDVGWSTIAKVEAGGIAGSHKWRHLFGTLVGLPVDDTRSLAIASCGNAALAAATLARAAGRTLRVFVPEWATMSVVEGLHRMGAAVEVVSRQVDERGDPCLRRFRHVVARGAVPFSCQGTDNALALDGGRTLGWELASQLAALDRPVAHVVVQVGGGALASCMVRALEEATQLGVLPVMPSVHAVQAAGAAPLVRAWKLLRADAAELGWEATLHRAAQERARYMQPWSDPSSVATGILDDETYDWLEVVRGVAMSGGSIFALSDPELTAAAAEASIRATTAVGPTGAAGLAGVRALQRRGVRGWFATVLTGST